MPEKIIIVGNGPLSKEQQEDIKIDKEEMGDDLLVCRFNHSPSWRRGDPVDILFLGVNAIKGRSLQHAKQIIYFDDKSNELLESYQQEAREGIDITNIPNEELGPLHEEIVKDYYENLSRISKKDISDYKVTVGFKAISYLSQKYNGVEIELYGFGISTETSTITDNSLGPNFSHEFCYTRDLFNKNKWIINNIDSDNYQHPNIYYFILAQDVRGVRESIKDYSGIDFTTGTTPLHLAVRVGNFKIIEELLANYPDDLKKIDEYGKSPLDIAKELEKQNITQLLENPLMMAVKLNNKEMLKLFLPLKEFLDKEDEDGNTPLKFAMSKRNSDFIKLLIDNGASIDHSGCSPDKMQYLMTEYQPSQEVRVENYVPLIASDPCNGNIQ